MKKLITVTLAAFIVAISAQAQESAKPQPAWFKVALTLLDKSPAKQIHFSGVYLADLDTQKIHRGGVAVEYSLLDWRVKDWIEGKAGPAVVTPADLEHLFVGIATTLSLVKDGAPERWIADRTPVKEASRFYLFIVGGSQVDKSNAFVAGGAGVKFW